MLATSQAPNWSLHKIADNKDNFKKMRTWAMYINLAFQSSPSGKKKCWKFADYTVTCMEELSLIY